MTRILMTRIKISAAILCFLLMLTAGCKGKPANGGSSKAASAAEDGIDWDDDWDDESPVSENTASRKIIAPTGKTATEPLLQDSSKSSAAPKKDASDNAPSGPSAEDSSAKGPSAKGPSETSTKPSDSSSSGSKPNPVNEEGWTKNY